MSAKPHVGFIGLGLMGSGMARNILKAGFPLTVMAHRRRETVDALVAQGASEATTPAEVAAASQILLLCLPGSPEVEATMTGKDGILVGAGTGLIVADCSTSDPRVTERLAEAAVSKGVVFVDAPLARTPKEAEEGRLNVMMGGREAVLEKLRPVFDSFCENIFHIGPVGSAHTIKLINNFLSLGIAGLVAEAVTAAKGLGIEPQKLYDLVSAGGANSAAFQMVMPYHLEGDPGGLKFTLANAAKDLGYFTQATSAKGVLSPIAESVHQSYLLACALGHHDDYVPQLADAWAKLKIRTT